MHVKVRKKKKNNISYFLIFIGQIFTIISFVFNKLFSLSFSIEKCFHPFVQFDFVFFEEN